MPKQNDYLHTCLALHSDLTEILYGRRQDIKRIEETTAKVRSSRRLTYEDIEKILDRQIWNADMFGYWPQRQEIELILERKTWDFWLLPIGEEKAIADLYSVFRQIEPVSVVLRFVVPGNYGIVSPPVEKVLGVNYFGNHQVPSENLHLEKYLSYLNDIRKLRDERGFDRAADVDMALWVLQMGVLEKRLIKNGNYKALWKGFRQDAKLRRIQARNLTKRLFDPNTMSRLDLAEALLVTDFQLAGLLAGIEFERSIKGRTGAKSDTNLRDEVQKFCRGKSPVFRRKCETAVTTRNKAAHSEPRSRLTKEEVEDMISVIREIKRIK